MSRGFRLSWTVVFVFVCFLLSGATGLLYETIWSRYLALFVGGSTAAHTLVLAVYMGGLALGNAVFGPLADRIRSPLAGYGWLEVGIGLCGLAFVVGFPLLTTVYVAMGAAASGLLVKLALGAIVLLLPTTLMGGTMPMLGRYLIERPRDIGAAIGFLYFINTAGAVFGCWLGGFALVEWLGLAGCMIVAAVSNLVIGAGTIAASRTQITSEGPEEEPVAGSGTQFSYSAGQGRFILGAVFVSGAIAMVFEIVWIRLVAVVFGSSAQSFAIMLMTFIAGIAVGGAVAGWWLRKDRDPLLAFGWCEIGVALLTICVVPLYERLPYMFATMRGLLSQSDGAYTMMQIGQVGLLMAFMLGPTVLMGMTLPLATRVATRSVGEVGAKVGRVFSINTVGTVVGVSLTGLVIMPFIGMQLTLYVAIIASLALGLTTLAVRYSRGVREADFGKSPGNVAIVGVVVSGLIAVVFVVVGSWDPVLLTAGFFRWKKMPASFAELVERYDDHELIFVADDADGTVTVVRTGTHRYLKVNGKTDASTATPDMKTQTMSAHLPLLLHSGEPREILVVGLGSGVTAGSALRHDVELVRVIELSEAVVEGAHYFLPENHHVFSDPRLDLRVGDAKDHLLLDEATYDIIISEPSNPWIAGVASLFSKQYFEAVISRLRTDGLFVQWLQMYSITDEAFGRTVATLRSVFPHVTVWRFSRADALFVASATPVVFDEERFRSRLQRSDVALDLREGRPVSVSEPLDLLAFQVLSADAVTEHYGDGKRRPVNSDYHPYLEFEAPRTMFRRDSAEELDILDQRFEDQGTTTLLADLHSRRSRPSPTTLLDLADKLRSSAEPLADRVEQVGLAEAPLYRLPGAAQALRDEREGVARVALSRRSTPTTPEDCQARVHSAGRVVLEGRTVFSPPPVDLVVSMADVCRDTFPTTALNTERTLAAVLFKLERWRAALQRSVAALENERLGGPDEQRAEIHRIAGRSAMELALTERAAEHYRELLRLVPDDDEARRLLGISTVDQEKREHNQ